MNRSQFLKLLGSAAVGAMATQAGPVVADEAPINLSWGALVPADAPKKLRTFLPSKPVDISSVPVEGETAPPPAGEGRWLSGGPPKASSTPPAVVQSLDGKRVRIGGYVVPLDFDATRVKEFLLVPFVGACIHVPPPPANQIIYVKSEKGFDVSGTFDPVYVTGKLATTAMFTGLAEAGYSLNAEAVDARKE